MIITVNAKEVFKYEVIKYDKNQEEGAEGAVYYVYDATLRVTNISSYTLNGIILTWFGGETSQYSGTHTSTGNATMTSTEFDYDGVTAQLKAMGLERNIGYNDVDLKVDNWAPGEQITYRGALNSVLRPCLVVVPEDQVAISFLLDTYQQADTWKYNDISLTVPDPKAVTVAQAVELINAGLALIDGTGGGGGGGSVTFATDEEVQNAYDTYVRW